MKSLVIACLVALAVGSDLRRSPEHPLPVPKIVRMIRQNGYKAETHTVQTVDGYVLKLFRMPCRICPLDRNESQENQQGSNQNSDFSLNRPAVLLMHNMLGSAEDWVYGGPSQGLAYHLADRGMDVYLGSSRGSKYGMEHTTLDPSKDSSFWAFTWDNIATKDMPAIITKVEEISHQRRIQIVGHMTGATATVVMVSEDPQARQRVGKIVALGPVSFMKRATQPFMKVVQANRENKPWIMGNLGMSVLTPSTRLKNRIETECKNMHQSQQDFCENLYFLVNDFNSNNFNQTTIKEVLQGVPSSTTVRQMLHMAQLMETGRFTKYQPDVEVPEAYNLTRATVPTIVMFAPEDRLSENDDVLTLVEKLPIARSIRIDSVTNNMDLLYSNNVNRINQKIASILRMRPYREEAGEEDNNSLYSMSL